MKILKNRKIQKQLFIFYSLLLLSVLAVLAIWLGIGFGTLTQDYSSKMMTQVAENANSNIDMVVQNMDMIAKQVVFSNVINDELFDESTMQKSIILPLTNRREISNALYSLLGPNFSTIEQINIIDYNTGNYISVGTFPLETIVAVSELKQCDWVQETICAEGKMCIISPHKDMWSVNSDNTVFSVTRLLISSIDEDRLGIVEVPCDVNKVNEIMDNILTSNDYLKKIFVFTKDNTLIYGSESEAHQYLSSIIENKQQGISSFKFGNEYVSYNVSENTGWTVLIVANESLVETPVSTVYTNTIIILIFAIIATLLLSYYLSGKFTKPISEIYNNINSIKFIKGQVNLNIDNDKNELEELSLFFESLCNRLDKAIDEAALAHSCETEARKMALEAQINPHFLYNTFAIIQTYAEEGETAEISAVCDDLAYLLRYAVSEKNIESTVCTELKACAIYLNLMHRRNFNRLSFSINVDKQILDKYMPRMILQPIVENSFKHGLMQNEEWKVDIRGFLEGDSWKIEISDNGCGIDESIINKIYDGIEKADFINYSMDDTHKSIGLVNIGIRLKLYLGEKMIFIIENKEDKGTKIIIGEKGGIKNGG